MQCLRVHSCTCRSSRCKYHPPLKAAHAHTQLTVRALPHLDRCDPLRCVHRLAEPTSCGFPMWPCSPPRSSNYAIFAVLRRLPPSTHHPDAIIGNDEHLSPVTRKISLMGEAALGQMHTQLVRPILHALEVVQHLIFLPPQIRHVCAPIPSQGNWQRYKGTGSTAFAQLDGQTVSRCLPDTYTLA